jgi:hypothetical protein
MTNPSSIHACCTETATPPGTVRIAAALARGDR